MAGRKDNGERRWGGAADLAETQHGVVSRVQLRGLGFSEATIDHAVSVGHLHRLFRGVFALGHRGVGWRGEMLAAVLASGPGSVVSHGTAAYLLGLWERKPQLIDVIAPVEAARKIQGIRRRHTPPPLSRDRRSHEGIPCTSPSRTIVDVAGAVGEVSLRRTIEQAAVHRVLDLAEIDAILAGPRRRGSPRLRTVLEDWRRYAPGVPLRSVMEAKLLSLLSQYDLPAPECNVKLRIGRETFEIDFFWRRERLAVETDGRRFHDNPEAEKRDRRRNRRLPRAGYRIWRLVWDDLEQRPAVTMHTLGRLLAGFDLS